MREAFRLQVPLEDRFRGLAAEVAGRYAELAGGSADDAVALTLATAAALDRMAGLTDAKEAVDLTFTPEPSGVEISVSCRQHHDTVKVTLTVARR